jgi:nicotinamidase-related amidase
MSKVVFGKQVFTTLEELVDPRHTALIIVDAQNDFCSPGGCLDQLQYSDMTLMRPFIENTQVLLSVARQSNVMVIFTKATNYPGGFYKSPPDLARKTEYLNPDSPLICACNSWGDRIIDELRPQSEEIIINKHRHNSFMGTELDIVLRSNGKKTVIITGVTTERCVLSTVIGAIAHDYYVVLPRNCVASQKADMHHAALTVISGNLLKEGVTDFRKIIEVWQSTS